MASGLSLPQFDKSNEIQRKKNLEAMQKEYEYTLTYDGFIATINKLPDREKPTLLYKIRSYINLAGLIPSLPSFISKLVKFKLLRRPFKSFNDYFFFSKSFFPNSEMRENFLDNKYLGYQRVAGMNPVVIEGVNGVNPIPKNFIVTAAALGLTESEYQTLFRDNRFYITNYDMLKPLSENPGYVEDERKYVLPAIALYKMQDDGCLEAMAIQLDATKPTNTKDNPIITPNDDRWAMARTYIQAADGTHQELWTHATRIHYILESIIMVSWRQLGENHPILALLKPHLKFTLSVNVNPLFEKTPDGKIPSFGKMFGCDNEALVAFMAEGMKSYSFKDFILTRDLEKRHVNDPRLVYPYRDDGLLLWNEIKRFTESYISYWYKIEQDITGDFELQKWANELGGSREEKFCGLTDFPTEFNNKDQLIEIVAHIIFIATAHHSSIHYPQYECAGFPPNLPFSSYVPPFTDPSNYQTESGLVKFFPPFSMAFEQAFIFYLTNFKVNRIGNYSINVFPKEVQGIIAEHQNQLLKIHKDIKDRNKSRKFSYPFMDPKNIPNSVTV